MSKKIKKILGMMMVFMMFVTMLPSVIVNASSTLEQPTVDVQIHKMVIKNKGKVTAIKDDTQEEVATDAIARPKLVMVENKAELTEEEKQAVKAAVIKANAKFLGKIQNVSVANDGTTTIKRGKVTYTLSSDYVCVKGLKNTGDIIPGETTSEYLEVYDPAKYGDLGFTAYKLDTDAVKAIDASKKPQEIAQEVEDAINEGTKPLPYGAVQITADEVKSVKKNNENTAYVDENGISTFTFEQKESAYVFIENVKPKTVSQAARPMFLWLPLNNKTNDGYKNPVHLYPKNVAGGLEQGLVKYFIKNGTENKPALLPGATFNLYKGTPTGITRTLKGDKYETTLPEGTEAIKGKDGQILELVTNEEGKITVKDLTVGKYFFVESKLPADYEDGKNQKPNLAISKYTGLTEENKLTFEVLSDGSFAYPDNSLLNVDKGVLNYEEPTIKKEVDKPIGSTEKNYFTFTLTNMTPKDIKDYVKYAIVDKPNENIIIDKDTIKIEGLPEGSYDITYPEPTEDDKSVGIGQGFRIDVKKDVIKDLEPDTAITVTYKGSLKADVAVNEYKPNVVYLPWDNGYQEGSPNSRVKIKTLSHKLHKIGRGLFGTNAAAPNLEGVVFKVYKEVQGGDAAPTQKWLTYVKDNETDEKGRVVYVDTEAEAQEFTTNAEGIIELYGLDEGKYAAKEIKTIDGYQLPTDPIRKFEVKDNQEGEEDDFGVKKSVTKQTEIENIKTPDMPHTGLYYSDLIAGGLILLIVAAMGAYVIKRKKIVNKAN